MSRNNAIERVHSLTDRVVAWQLVQPFNKETLSLLVQLSFVFLSIISPTT